MSQPLESKDLGALRLKALVAEKLPDLDDSYKERILKTFLIVRDGGPECQSPDYPDKFLESWYLNLQSPNWPALFLQYINGMYRDMRRAEEKKKRKLEAQKNAPPKEQMSLFHPEAYTSVELETLWPPQA